MARCGYGAGTVEAGVNRTLGRTTTREPLGRPSAVTAAVVHRATRDGPRGVPMVRLYVRVRAEGKDRYASLGVTLKAKDWNPERGEVRTTHREHRDLNHLVTEARARAERGVAELRARALAEGRRVTVAEAEAVAREAAQPDVSREGLRSGEAPPRPGVLALLGERERVARVEGRVGTARNYEAARSKLAAFLKRDGKKGVSPGVSPGGDVDFGRVDVAFVRRFEHHLRAPAPEGRGNAPGTVAKTLAALRAVCREAIRRGLVEQAAYPFFGVKVRRPRKARPSLSAEEVAALARAELSGFDAVARDAWLLAFFGGGMRFGDVARLRFADVAGGRLRYRMAKNQKAQSLPLLPEAAAIVDRYRHREAAGRERVFPLLDGYDASTPEAEHLAVHRALARVNKALRRTGEALGFRARLTSHLARHALARHLLERGVGVYAIKDLLKHGDVGTTQGYLEDVAEGALDATFLGAFAEATPPKAEDDGSGKEAT